MVVNFLLFMLIAIGMGLLIGFIMVYLIPFRWYEKFLNFEVRINKFKFRPYGKIETLDPGSDLYEAIGRARETWGYQEDGEGI